MMQAENMQNVQIVKIHSEQHRDEVSGIITGFNELSVFSFDR